MRLGPRVLMVFGLAIMILTAFASGTSATAPPYVTRAQFVRDLDVALGVAPVYPATPTFSDVPTTNPYYGYVEAAFQRGLIAGYSATVFGVDGLLTREQVAKIEVAALGDVSQALQQMSTRSRFTDDAHISAFARGYVNEAAQLGLVHGYPDGSFRPGAYVTTSDEAAFIRQLTAVISGTAAPATPAVIATVTVGKDPVGIAVDPATDRIYVLNQGSETVSVIDGATDKIVATVPVGYAPRLIGVDATTDTVYVTDVSTADGSNRVLVINGANDVVTSSIAIPSAGSALAVDPLTDNVDVFGAAGYGTPTYVIDAVKGILAATIPANRIYEGGSPLCCGTGPANVAFDAATGGILVTDGANITEIDGATGKEVALYSGPNDPSAIAVDSSTGHVYVAGYQNGCDGEALAVLGGPSLSVIHQFGFGGVCEGSNAVGVDSSTHAVYLVHSDQGSVTVLDGSTWLVTGTVTVGLYPTAVGVDPLTDRIYVVNTSSGTVSVIAG